MLNSELKKVSDLASPIRRYTKRMTRVFESTQSELVTLRKEVADQRELLRARKARKARKKGMYILTIL